MLAQAPCGVEQIAAFAPFFCINTIFHRFQRAEKAFTENLFHEEKTLEKHLASLHGFLTLLKAIEDSSLLLYSDTYVIQLLDALTFLVQLGGFQLLDLIITELKSHMTC